ncbi:MAG: maleylpyruvate isomerase N-terminal domain-containing protein, partial [Pseudonocardiales bacterium]|nr:maleylpyruvate isomerase N-terminal domain-containing protein [Pseudonocardiales bacterium]
MKVADYQSRIATEAGMLREAAIALDADTPVPTCAGWTVRRLIQHLGRVF